MAYELKGKMVIDGEGNAKTMLGDLGTGIRGVDGALKKVGATFAAYFSYQFIKSQLQQSLRAWTEQEDALYRLAGAMKANDIPPEMMKNYQDFSTVMQNITVFADENTNAFQAQALLMGATADEVNDLTRAAMGLSTVLGGDLMGNLRLLQLAQQGIFMRQLQFVPAVRAAQTQQEKWNAVMKLSNDGFLMAQERLESVSGRMQWFKNLLGDQVYERFGKALGDEIVPMLKDLGATLSDEKTQRSLEMWALFFGNMARFGGGYIGLVNSFFLKIQDTVQNTVGDLDRAMDEFKILFMGDPEAMKRKFSPATVSKSTATTTYGYGISTSGVPAGTPMIGGGLQFKGKTDEGLKDEQDKIKAKIEWEKDNFNRYYEMMLDKYRENRDKKLAIEDEAYARRQRLDARDLQRKQELYAAETMAYQSMFTNMNQLGEMWGNKELTMLGSIGGQGMSLVSLYAALAPIRDAGKFGLAGVAMGIATVAAIAGTVAQANNIYGKMKNTSGGGGGGVTAPSSGSYMSTTYNQSSNDKSATYNISFGYGTNRNIYRRDLISTIKEYERLRA